MSAPRERAGMLVVRDGIVVYASEGAAALAERPLGEIVGRPYEDFIVPEERAAARDRYERRLRGETMTQDVGLAIALPGGGRRLLEVHAERDGRDLVVHLRDLAAREARRLRLEAVASLGAALQREATEEEIFARLRSGLRELGLSSALLREEPEGIRHLWASVPESVRKGFFALTGRALDGYLGRSTDLTRRVLAEGSAFTDDWALEASRFLPESLAERAREIASSAGASKAMAVRIEERAGTRHLLLVIGDWLSADDAPALRLFVAQLTAALDAARRIADLSRRNADLAALNRVAELAAEATELPAFLERASRVLREAAGCAGMGIYVLDEARGELVGTYVDGLAPAVARRIARISSSGLLGDVMRERAARVVDVSAGVPNRSLTMLGFRTLAWVPLVVRSRAVGVLTTGFQAPAEEVRGRVDLLTAVGAHVAAVVESHGLLSDLRRRVDELTLLNDVALASARDDPKALLDSALRRVCDTVGATVGSAWVRDGQRLVLVAESGMADACAQGISQLPVGEGAPGRAVERAEPVLGDSLEAYAGRCARIGACGEVGPVLAVPLLAKGEAVGALALGRREGQVFSPEEVRLLSAIGVQLGVAVRSAQLFSDVKRRASDLEAVNALALRIFETAPGDLATLLEGGCREIARALSCRSAALFLADEGEGTLRLAGGWGRPAPPADARIDVARDGLVQDALRRKIPVASEDVTRDPRSVMHGRPGIPPLAMLAVPLGSRGEPRGVLFLADDAGRRFTADEVALAVTLASGLGVGIENAELYADANRRVEELSLLNEIGRTIAASLDLDHLIRDAADAARRIVGASRAFVLLFDPLRAEVRYAGGAGVPAGDFDHFRALLDEGTLAARVIRDRSPVVLEDAGAYPALDPVYRSEFAGRSLVAAPVLLRGEPLGVLVVDEVERRRAFGESDVQRVSAIANQLAVAVENARLFAEARGRLRELTTVIDVARVVSSSLDLEEVLGAGAEHLKRTLEASACTILLEDVRAQELRRAASRGEPLGPERIALDRPSLLREALDARAPVSASAAQGADTSAPSILAVPLHVRDHPVGVALVAGGSERVFSPGELSRASAIASQLAVAVDNARLYSETRRRAEELGLLHEVGRSLVATLDLHELLDAGARNIARIVDAPVAVVLLSTPEGTHAEVRAAAGGLREHLGLRLPLDPPESSLSALVFRRREPVLVEDALVDPRVNARLRAELGGRGYLGVPLIVRERSIGAVLVVETRGPRRFTPAEVERAAAIANQLAVAVENARLYEDLRRSYAQLERAQQQIIQSERLAALGELSAVVAHEVRNPLGVIFNSLGSLRRLLRPQGDAKMLLDIVGEEADRLNRIVGDLLDFARPARPELRPERFDRIVEEAVDAALSQRPSGIALARELDPTLPPVPLDARLVRQVVLNVAVNAVQAMPRGGRVTVRTRRDGAHALLEIEDTGPGIPEEVQTRIFEPFFTTKASGTGLGLAVVKRIVDGHGGAISVQSRAGEGTVFALRFPLQAVVEKEPAIG